MDHRKPQPTSNAPTIDHSRPRRAVGRVPSLHAASLCLLLSFTAGEALAHPPRIVAANPDFGDAQVDPDLKELRIEFDQDMQGGRSICGGGPAFPQLSGNPRWETPRVIVIPVTLQADHEYRFSVNCPSAQNFRAVTGEAAEIAQVAFRTAKNHEAARPPPTLTPAANQQAYQALRTAIDERYSYRNLRVKDWEALFAANEEALMSARTPGAFARAAAELLAPAKDIHVKVWVADRDLFTYRAGPRFNGNPDLTAKLVPGFKQRNRTVASGRFDDHIGYVQINTWPPEDGPAEQSAAPALEAIDELMDCKALIVDVRANGGGSETTARQVAARFVKKPTVYSLSRFRDLNSATGWTEPAPRRVKPDDSAARFTGRVIVLIGQACASSNESFIAMMKHGAEATLVGETTLGSSGNPQRADLGNGVQVSLPSWQDLMPDGTLLEGRGIAPDIEAGKGSDYKSQDPALDAALKLLRGQK